MKRPKVSRGGKKFHATKQDFALRNDLPYGVWLCENGREVLFNRFYEPLFERRGEKVREADPQEWVEGVLQKSFFYRDETPDKEKREAATKALLDWGL